LQERKTLWNAVEQKEKNSNSQLAREIEFSLPREFDRENQIRLVREYVQANFVDHGMCADFAVHDKNDGNPHAHVMLTLRPIEQNGEWGAKSKKVYDLDQNGEKIPLKSGKGYKSHHVDLTDWDSHANAEKWREQWAAMCNGEFQRLGLDKRVTHESYERQGIDQQPTVHLGKNAHQREQRGERSRLGDLNREIRRDNQEYAESVSSLEQEIAGLQSEAQGQNTLDSLRNEYIELSVFINQQQAAHDDLAHQSRNLAGQLEDLDERSRIIFASSPTPSQRAKLLQEQAVRALQRDYGIAPDEIPAKVRELQSTAESVRQQQSNLPDLSRLQERQQHLEQEYTKQHSSTLPHQEEQKPDAPNGQSLADQMAAKNAGRRLDSLTKPKEQKQEQSQSHEYGH
jgi:ATP-dependent exoDNAse (exonuclease V) alpha subunit